MDNLEYYKKAANKMMKLARQPEFKQYTNDLVTASVVINELTTLHVADRKIISSLAENASTSMETGSQPEKGENYEN